MNILLVEDLPGQRRHLATELRRAYPHAVVTAPTEPNALARACEHSVWDAVISDQDLKHFNEQIVQEGISIGSTNAPFNNGLALLKHVRFRPNHSALVYTLNPRGLPESLGADGTVGVLARTKDEVLFKAIDTAGPLHNPHRDCFFVYSDNPDAIAEAATNKRLLQLALRLFDTHIPIADEPILIAEGNGMYAGTQPLDSASVQLRVERELDPVTRLVLDIRVTLQPSNETIVHSGRCVDLQYHPIVHHSNPPAGTLTPVLKLAHAVTQLHFCHQLVYALVHETCDPPLLSGIDFRMITRFRLETCRLLCVQRLYKTLNYSYVESAAESENYCELSPRFDITPATIRGWQKPLVDLGFEEIISLEWHAIQHTVQDHDTPLPTTNLPDKPYVRTTQRSLFLPLQSVPSDLLTAYVEEAGPGSTCFERITYRSKDKSDNSTPLLPLVTAIPLHASKYNYPDPRHYCQL